MIARAKTPRRKEMPASFTLLRVFAALRETGFLMLRSEKPAAPAACKPPLWIEALCQTVVWKRAAVIGLPIGVLQAVINQGDVWLRHEETLGTVAKTIISPLVTFSVALISAAGVWVERQRTLNN
jgi:hypothetical protein